MSDETVRVLGLDPGGFSGIVLADVVDRTINWVPEWHELNQRDTAEFLFDQFGPGGDLDFVVCEEWVPLGGPKKFKPQSLELIGLTRGLCWHYGVPLALVNRVMKERFHAAALQQFPEVGRGSKDGHARDALAHVIGWAQTRQVVS